MELFITPSVTFQESSCSPQTLMLLYIIFIQHSIIITTRRLCVYTSHDTHFFRVNVVRVSVSVSVELLKLSDWTEGVYGVLLFRCGSDVS